MWSAPLFAAGIAIYFAQKTEPHWVAAALPPLLIVCLRQLCLTIPVVVALLNAACLLAAGFATAKLRTEWVRAPVLVQPLRNAIVTGHLVRLELRADKSRRMTLQVVATCRPWTVTTRPLACACA